MMLVSKENAYIEIERKLPIENANMNIKATICCEKSKNSKKYAIINKPT